VKIQGYWTPCEPKPIGSGWLGFACISISMEHSNAFNRMGFEFQGRLVKIFFGREDGKYEKGSAR
jgi:hypothetical protein